jgi:hypothetical protein
MYILGSECTITLNRNDELTAIPYTLETLREENQWAELDPLVGYIMPIGLVRNGFAVLGCVVTRVCGISLLAIAGLLRTGPEQTFILYLNRIVEKRIYRKLILTGWEVRADRDEALYVRFDMEGEEAADWDYQTPDLPWEQNETLSFFDTDIVLDGKASTNIYRFSLTRLFGDAIATVLQLHYPLKDGDELNDCRSLTLVTLTFGDRLRITLTSLILLSFNANTDNAEEILVVRRFRVDGECLVTVRNAKGEWVTPE